MILKDTAGEPVLLQDLGIHARLLGSRCQWNHVWLAPGFQDGGAEATGTGGMGGPFPSWFGARLVPTQEAIEGKDFDFSIMLSWPWNSHL